MSDGGSVVRGFLIGAGVTLAGLAAGALTFMIGIGMVVVFGIGLVQLAWILPMFFKYRSKGEPQTANGLLIAAGIVFLLNASCWGMMSKTTFH